MVHRLPEKRPDESNTQYCQRAADSIPADVLLTQIISFCVQAMGWGRTTDVVQSCTNHGRGISSAIVRRCFVPPPIEDDPGGDCAQDLSR